jgi:hypothetical protein
MGHVTEIIQTVIVASHSSNAIAGNVLSYVGNGVRSRCDDRRAGMQSLINVVVWAYRKAGLGLSSAGIASRASTAFLPEVIFLDDDPP